MAQTLISIKLFCTLVKVFSMQLTHKMRYFLILGFLSLLVGCGFHLRGSVSIPEQYKTAYIESNEPAYSVDSVAFYIKRGLRSQLDFVDSIDKADLIITVQEGYDSRIVASSATGQFRSYTTELLSTITIQDRAGKLLFPRQSFSSSESFSLNERDPLAKSTAEESIKRELAQDTSNSFIRRLEMQMRTIK